MKIALITDQHAGARGDSTIFSDYFGKFYKNTFFPYIDKHEISHIIDLGDTFDKRKYINYVSLSAFKNYWFDEVAKRNITLDVIVGNHCTAYKNTNEVNSPDLLLREYSNVNVYSSPTDITVGDLDIAIVPWICSGNFNETMDFLDATKSQIVFGHLEIAGFEMYKGSPSDHGFSAELFGKFDLVCSGHFHHKSTKGNINYLGAPYEMNWSDWNDPRGFHIFDTETRELTFIENEYKMFHKISYDDSNKSLEELLDISDKLSGSYVKIVITNKTNPVWFDMYLDKIEKMGVVDFQIIDEYAPIDFSTDEDEDDIEDTLSILKKVIDQIEVRVEKKDLESFMTNLYQEAVSVE